MKIPELLSLFPDEWRKGDLVIVPSIDQFGKDESEIFILYRVTDTERKDGLVWAYSREGVLQMFNVRPWHGRRQWLIIRYT